ncbi:MAG: GHKL domain-containing protein [Cyclobacteriaceae bacterium]|nr:GHKL domain-containing protein [Cyclobacteriaceae bacterium]
MAHTIPFYQSLRTKAAALFFLAFMVIVLPANWFVFQKIKTTLHEADGQELRAEAEKIASRISLDPLTIPLPPLGYLLQVNQSTLAEPTTLFSSPDFPDISTFEPTSSYSLIDTLKIVHLKKEVPYVAPVIVSLARSTSFVELQIRQMQNYLLLANVLSLLLAGALIFWAAGRMLNPLRKIISTASQITASKEMSRVEVPSTNDESKLLANTLNEMIVRLESSIKNQVNFFASATHELKTPLTIMQTELAVSLEKSHEDTNKILTSQLHEVRKLNRIVEDFLLISQLKSDSLTLRKKRELVEEIIYTSLKSVQPLAVAKNIQINLSLHEEGGATAAILDAEKFEIVLKNLLENAIKYSDSNTTITLQLNRDANHAQLRVINPTIQSFTTIEILKREFQKSNEHSHGLGMGLWICDQVLKLHQFRFTLLCENQVFEARIEIPLAD